MNNGVAINLGRHSSGYAEKLFIVRGSDCNAERQAGKELLSYYCELALLLCCCIHPSLLTTGYLLGHRGWLTRDTYMCLLVRVEGEMSAILSDMLLVI